MSNYQLAGDDIRYQQGRIALIIGRYNDHIVSRLLDGVTRKLAVLGVADEDIEQFTVPGAYEMPLAAQACAESGRFDAVIALGAVIRGGTPHFEFVAGECSRGLLDVGLKHHLPVIFGVLTTDSEAQAEERADPARLDKGGEAAMTAVEMINLLAGLKS